MSVLKKIVGQGSALFGVLIILLAILVSFFGANIRPDQSVDANEQELALSKLKPLSIVKLIKVETTRSIDSSNFFTKLFFGGRNSSIQHIPFDSLFISGDQLYYAPYNSGITNPSAFKSIPLNTLLGGLADSLQFDGANYLLFKQGKPRSIGFQVLSLNIKTTSLLAKTYYLGTDTFGRDLLSRLMAGTIVSLSVGLIAVVISLLLGVFLGGLAGYYRGWVDSVIMWFVNVVWSVPTMLMVIAITVALGKGFTQVFIAVGFTMWVEVARVVRGQFMQLREKDYISAAKLMGFSDLRIIFKHLLPNAVGPLIVISAGNFSTAILLESGLSFLGIGAQVPMPSWGGIIKAHFNYITTDYAYLALLPGACLSILTLAFMLVGNGIRDALDVKL